MLTVSLSNDAALTAKCFLFFNVLFQICRLTHWMWRLLVWKVRTRWTLSLCWIGEGVRKIRYYGKWNRYGQEPCTFLEEWQQRLTWRTTSQKHWCGRCNSVKNIMIQGNWMNGLKGGKMHCQRIVKGFIDS